MDQDTVDAITRAASEGGVDPAFALAVADRESGGHHDWNDPGAHSSKTIFGLFQMRGDLRSQYGVGNSSDPYTQAKGWTAFIGDQKAQMASALGRDPTNNELYFAHHFGTERAIQMINGTTPASTSVADVFSPNERANNPHFDKAGTTGNLMTSIGADMDRRTAQFGGASTSSPDFASFGVGQDGQAPGNTALTYKSTNAQPVDFAAFGSAPTYQADSSSPGNATTPSSGAGGLGGLVAELGKDITKAETPATPAAPTQVASAEPVYGMSGPRRRRMRAIPAFSNSAWRRCAAVAQEPARKSTLANS